MRVLVRWEDLTEEQRATRTAHLEVRWGCVYLELSGGRAVAHAMPTKTDQR